MSYLNGCISKSQKDLFLDLRKGYAEHHERSRHDLHVCRKVFDPGCPLRSRDLKRVGFSVELTDSNVQQTVQKLSGAVQTY